jgi:hypothetical protein
MEIDALGHDWSAWKQTKAPTTKATGLKERSCKHCGEKETAVVPKLTAKQAIGPGASAAAADIVITGGAHEAEQEEKGKEARGSKI